MSEDHKPTKSEMFDLSDHNTSGMTFGECMRSLRKAKQISLRSLAKEVGKTPTYISDIENGNNRPPDKPLLDSIIAALRIDDNPRLCGKLFDLAALGRGDIPADIKSFVFENPSIISILRILQTSPNRIEILAEMVSQYGNGGTRNDSE